MSDGNVFKIDTSLIKKDKNLVFDKNSQCLYKIKKYDLTKSRSAILASIYFEYQNKKTSITMEGIELLELGHIEDVFDILRQKYKFNNLQARGIVVILTKFSYIHIIIIVDNLKHLNQEDTIKFLENFVDLKGGNLNIDMSLKFNDLILYFLLKDRGIDLFNKIKSDYSNTDKKRKYIVDFLNVIKNDLKKSSISELLELEKLKIKNKDEKNQIKLLNKLIEHRLV